MDERKEWDVKLSDWKPSQHDRITGLSDKDLEIIDYYLNPHHMFDFDAKDVRAKVEHELEIRRKGGRN